MAVTVITTCARCGDVELPVADARLLVPTEDEPTAVEFACPHCGSPQHQGLTERATLLLMRAGVVVSADAGPVGTQRLPSPSDESR